MSYDAEGHAGLERCPECKALDTVTYEYEEGFSELECRACGYSSELDEIGALTRFDGSLKEADGAPGDRPRVPVKRIEA
jgi:uncharacterized metal-binding protein (TIGR02443 family)